MDGTPPSKSTPMRSSSPPVAIRASGATPPHDAMRTPATLSAWLPWPVPGSATPSWSSSTPSGLLEPDDAAGTLVSEAARGEGGILTNALGERFMERYDPERMELSTRDRVALAGFTEVAEAEGLRRAGGSTWTSPTCPERPSWKSCPGFIAP